MTVSVSQGRRFTIAQHISIAYKTAGIVELSQEPNSAQYGVARQFLENILDSLDTYGVFARVVTFHELQLVAGTYIYDFPEHILEVVKTGMYIDPEEPESSGAETPVYQIRREEWQILSVGGSGRPVKYFNDRNGDIQRVYLWMVPDQAGIIRFQVVRALADADDNSATLDLQVWWNKYIQYALATAIAEASSLAAGKVAQLEAKSRKELEMCQGKANEFSPSQMYVDHGPMGSYGRMHR